MGAPFFRGVGFSTRLIRRCVCLVLDSCASPCGSAPAFGRAEEFLFVPYGPAEAVPDTKQHPHVIFGVVGYLIAGFMICGTTYAVLGILIEHRTKAHIPTRGWWVKRSVLEMCRVHRRLYPNSYVVIAFWGALVATIAFWVAGACLQSMQKKAMHAPNVVQVERWER